MQLQEAKVFFRQWWDTMQTMQSKYGGPEDGPDIEERPEFGELQAAHFGLCHSMSEQTGISPFIFRKAILMAMEKTLQPDDDNPTDEQVDSILDLSLAFAMAANQRVNEHEGKPLN
jgi:hypothetical protein